MKFHFVTPTNPASFWTYDTILPTLDRACLFPNLSMPTVAGLTPAHHEIILCDENVEPIDFDAEADIVGVTGYIVHRERMLEIIGEFRRRGRFVVVGGPAASLCPEEFRGHCDALFVGEAEETWPQFLRDFEVGAWKSEYVTEERPDLSNPPMPRFDLMPVDRYLNMTVQFARGCPFRCEFCDIIVIYGRRPRSKSVECMMAEIRECHRLGAAQIFIVDDNFIGDAKRAKALLRAIAEWNGDNGYPLTFNTEVSLNVAQDDELLELLRQANFTTLFIGIESPRPTSLEETLKTQNMRGDIVEAVHKVQSYGIQIQAGMILGFDNEDSSIFDEHLRFIQSARIPVSMTGMLQALPNTPLRERVALEGRLITESQGDQFVFSNIEPQKMTRSELFRGYADLIHDLYSYRNFGRRCREYLWNRGERVASHAIRKRELKLGARVLRDTLLHSGLRRALFTSRLLIETAFRRPSLLADAISLAVIHKGLSEYVRALSQHLEVVTQRIERPTVEAHDRFSTSVQQSVRLPADH
ncbi:MAG: B12-binding domain-containing radical SAM protein [bacterium]|nr:B12-binding domain-containing radical SAM protein [bacterium]